MSATTPLQLSQFALDVAEGLSSAGQKRIPPRYFYDDLGSTLFEAITLLPEYGLTRAEERLLQSYASDIAAVMGPLAAVAELGSGSGLKTRHILQAALHSQTRLTYHPIDVSTGALTTCERQISDLANVEPVCADWMDGLTQIARSRTSHDPLLLLFLGSSIGNISRRDLSGFLQTVRSHLRRGDFFLLGLDLIKETDRMLLAYDDPTRVTAAFNLNLLGRINRELDGNFDLRSFHHDVWWDENERRIEMHLRCVQEQTVYIAAVDSEFHFRKGETIWTESSHKFADDELSALALSNGFSPDSSWINEEWPFAEVLWRAD